MALDTRALLAGRIADTLSELYGGDAAADLKLTDASNRLQRHKTRGDYQCSVAIGLGKRLHQRPRDVAAAIVEALDVTYVCHTPSIADLGFINFTLTDRFVKDRLYAMYADRIRLGVPPRTATQRIVVDFSSPNIAKDMHVGHLRSTIIGDTLARILEFLGHEIIRLNHTGDWGTQFGQLIAFIKDDCPERLTGEQDTTTEIGDLVVFYRQAKKRFDEEPEFKSRAQAEVVRLQGGDPEALRAWNMICDVSRAEFEKVYSRLDIKLQERGESFYNPFLRDVVSGLIDENLAVEDEGAMVVFLDDDRFTSRDGTPLPLMVQKADGGFNYATTDLAAIQYRVVEDMADRILYVTDVGQTQHFQMILGVARMAGLLPARVKAEHVSFGLVQDENGKRFQTRSGAAPKLSKLLDEARDRVRQELNSRAADEAAEARERGRDPPVLRPEEELECISEQIGVAAIKYADLKNNRKSNYKFSFDKMVKLEGDTAPYIMYAYARVQGIYRQATEAVGGTGDTPEEIQFMFEKPQERALAKALLKLPEVLTELEQDLLPHVLCEFVLGLTYKFNQFYEVCAVLQAGSPELQNSRMALCQISADTLKLCLGLLGIPTLDRI